MQNLTRRILVFVMLVSIVLGLSPALPAKAEDVTKELTVSDYNGDFFSDDKAGDTQSIFTSKGTTTYKFHLDELSILSVNFYARNEYEASKSVKYESFMSYKMYDSNNKLLFSCSDKAPITDIMQNIILPSGDYYIKVKNDLPCENIDPEDYNNYLKDVNYYKLDVVGLKVKNIYDHIFVKNKKSYKVNYDNFNYLFGIGFAHTKKNAPIDFDNLVYGKKYTYVIGYFRMPDPYNIKELTFNLNIKGPKSEPKITFTNETKDFMEGKLSTRKDKRKPEVGGVKNNKTYKKKVELSVYDRSGIKKVTLNGKKISVKKAEYGYTVKEKKKYTLCVWDKSGNKRTVKFRIK